MIEAACNERGKDSSRPPGTRRNDLHQDTAHKRQFLAPSSTRVEVTISPLSTKPSPTGSRSFPFPPTTLKGLPTHQGSTPNQQTQHERPPLAAGTFPPLSPPNCSHCPRTTPSYFPTCQMSPPGQMNTSESLSRRF